MPARRSSSAPPACSVPSCADISRRRSWRLGWLFWRREYNGALVAVERNNHGHAVIAHLAMSVGYQNLYPGGGPPGWLTTAASRPRMLENFAAVLSSASFLFLSPRLLQECRTFIRHSDGTSAAAGGAHDDTVMAMAIALAVALKLWCVRPNPCTSAISPSCKLREKHTCSRMVRKRSHKVSDESGFDCRLL